MGHLVAVVRKQAGIPKQYLFNAAAALFFATTAIFMLRSTFDFSPCASCTERFHTRTAYDMQSYDGLALDISSLQAIAGEFEWGMLDNAVVRNLTDAPSPVAMKVSLPAGGARGGTIEKPVSGIGFTWASDLPRIADGGCLSYHIYLPESFSFEGSGVLPGLILAANRGDVTGEARTRIELPLRWINEGRVGALMRTGAGTSGREIRANVGNPYWKTGRWLHVAQEVIVNAPGEANGILRVWVDVRLVMEHEKIVFGDDLQGYAVGGAIGNVHYATVGGTWAPAPNHTAVNITPFELRLP